MIRSRRLSPAATGLTDRVVRFVWPLCVERTGGFPRAVSVRPFILRLRDRSGGWGRFCERSRV